MSQGRLETTDRVTVCCILRASLNSIEDFLFDIFLSFVIEFGVINIFFTIAAGHRRIKGVALLLVALL
jgi:hypothetical protein